MSDVRLKVEGAEQIRLIMAAPIGPPGPTDNADAAAEEARQAAQEARDAAQPLTEQKEAAEAARDAAIEAQGLAEGARDAAEGHATTAGTARDQAVAAQGAAESAASAASSHASAAAGSASAAEGSASSASGSASAAAGSATAAQTAQGHAEDARDAAQGYAEDAQQAAQATAADRLAVSQDRQAIESEQAARLAAIEDAGDTQVGRVENEGDTQVQRVIDAGDELAIVVPDPAPQPDGRVLTTWGGALAYAPDLAAAVAVAGANPSLVTIYETGRRAVSSPASAYGQQTDSGHTWVAVPGSAGDPVLDYHPNGYLLGSHAPSTSHPADTIGMSIVDYVLPAGSQYRVGAVMDASYTPNWARYLVVALTPDGDRLMLALYNYSVTLWAVIDGAATSLGSWGNSGQGDIGTSTWTAVSAWVRRAHNNYTVTGRAVDVYLSERFLFRALLPEKFANSAARIGLATPRSTPIFGFWLMGG